MRGPTDEARKEARRRYEAGESMNAIAKSLNVRRQSLMKIRDEEVWTPAHNEQELAHVREKTKAESQARVIDIATRKTVERIESSGVLDEMVLDLARDVQMTSRLGKAVDHTIDKFLRDAITVGPTQNEADVLKSIITAAKAYAELRRTMAGKTVGEASFDMGPKVDPNIKLTVTRLPAKPDEAKSA